MQVEQRKSIADILAGGRADIEKVRDHVGEVVRITATGTRETRNGVKAVFFVQYDGDPEEDSTETEFWSTSVIEERLKALEENGYLAGDGVQLRIVQVTSKNGNAYFDLEDAG
jgi:hypothetical protein